MNDYKSQESYEAKTLILNDANGNDLFCYLEQIVKVEGKEYALLTPVDTPVSLFKINEKDEPELIEKIEKNEQVLKNADAVLQEHDLKLIRSAVTVTGGVLSVAKSGDNPQFTLEEAKAVVSAAKDYGMWVAVHAHGPQGMKRAVIAGVDSVEHGTFMTEEIMDLMIKNDTYYVPTISAGEWVAEKAEIDNFFPEIVRPKAASVGPQIGSTFGKAYKRGVKIAFGTDAGVQAHGTNWKEFVYMTQYGMEPMDAIASATIETAKLLGEFDRLGSISVGKIADIIAVSGDPLKDMNNMKDVIFVMKEGKVFVDKRNE